MTFLFYAAAVVLTVALLSMVFMRASPTRLADSVRLVGPAVLGLGGVVLLLIGRAGMGGMLLSGALAWYMSARARRNARPQPGQRSHVRTAALEMELDHDSGGLQGLVLAGRFEGRELAELDLPQLLALRQELAGDGESLQLLETYLDGRFAAWRDDTHPDDGDRLRAAPASGAMTEEEAYKILGLEAGASTAEIRKAHRRLMQRLHPDLGGSSFLAARINEAKDILLGGQR
ncbi:MAG TPA: DnaJ domain-containing protein [Rhizobiaceae bacterium]|nr:DnaJ domain-containing protein [Rhizobiaceae bacterium]